MGKDSNIEWTDHTFNISWGCFKVSEGCKHCYADTLATRYGHNVWGPPATTERRTFGEAHWKEPLKWNKAAEKAGQRARVFCSSMADVFENHPTINTERVKLWDLIRRTPWLDWQLLTKRPENIIDMLPADWGEDGYSNVWLGTSVENQAAADTRIMKLVEVPCKIRFLSCEPLLGPVDLSKYLNLEAIHSDLNTRVITKLRQWIAWVIVGGESGSSARVIHPEWVRSIRNQCQEADVGFFFKQWGEWLPITWKEAFDLAYSPKRHEVVDAKGDHIYLQAGHFAMGHQPDEICLVKVGKKKAGRVLDGRTWDEMPTPVI